jgi:hypothetical protein
VITTAEESLELAGTVLFIDALMRYIGRYFGDVRLRMVDSV